MHAAGKQMESPCSEISLSLSSTRHESRFKEHSLNPFVCFFDTLHSGNVHKAHPVHLLPEIRINYIDIHFLSRTVSVKTTVLFFAVWMTSINTNLNLL